MSIHNCLSDRSHYAAIKTTQHDGSYDGSKLIDDSNPTFFSKPGIIAPWFEVELDVPVVMTGVGKGN